MKDKILVRNRCALLQLINGSLTETVSVSVFEQTIKRTDSERHSSSTVGYLPPLRGRDGNAPRDMEGVVYRHPWER